MFKTVKLSDPYLVLLSGEHVPESWLAAQLPEKSECPGVTDIFNALDQLDLEIEEKRVVEKQMEGARWEIEFKRKITIEVDGQEQELEKLYRVWAMPSEKIQDILLDLAFHSESEKEEAKRSKFSLFLATNFLADPVSEIFEQLNILYALAPEALAFIDVVAYSVSSHHEIKDLLEEGIEPSVESLFTIHAVADDDSNLVWLHTHGLLRCGLPEIEMIDIPVSHREIYGKIINAIASLFLEQGVVEPGDHFMAGDQLELAWLPWEKGINRIKIKGCGGLQDHDENHAYPSMVILKPQKSLFGTRYRPISAYLKLLDDDPMLYLSHRETERVANLAKVRFDRFKTIFDKCSPSEDWLFLVKLGYPVDDLEGHEHLWFEVKSIDNQKVEAKLVNDPIHISALKLNDVGMHSTELLSEWSILSQEYGNFSPYSIQQLEEMMQEKQLSK